MSAQSFGTRLQQAVADRGPIVAGIDPHAALLEAWGLPDTPAGLAEFSRVGLEAVAGQVAAVKPQSAFFERHGSARVAGLEELLAEARPAAVLPTPDDKRGDGGSPRAAAAHA